MADPPTDGVAELLVPHEWVVASDAIVHRGLIPRGPKPPGRRGRPLVEPDLQPSGEEIEPGRRPGRSWRRFVGESDPADTARERDRHAEHVGVADTLVGRPHAAVREPERRPVFTSR